MDLQAGGGRARIPSLIAALSVAVSFLPTTGIAADIEGHEHTEYLAIKEHLTRGWNTWNTRPVLSHTPLPEGFGLNDDRGNGGRSFDHAQRMVAEHLMNPEEFWGDRVIPSIARDDQRLSSDRFHSWGPCWVSCPSSSRARCRRRRIG